MPDRLKYVKVIFGPTGQIEREYKSVHYEGEGAPRDVEIDPFERQVLFGEARDLGAAVVSALQGDMLRLAAEKSDAEGRLVDLQARYEDQTARLNRVDQDFGNLQVQYDIKRAELEATQVQLNEVSAALSDLERDAAALRARLAEAGL